MRRYCKRFYCDHMGERICCAGCRYRRDCDNPCLNHPSRCGLEDLTRGKTAGDNPSVGGADSSPGGDAKSPTRLTAGAPFRQGGR